MANSPIDTLIIGAGMAGAVAGRILHDAGREVVLLDKGRGVGGRCATRRIEDAVYDHGAQFFTVREPSFQRWVDRWRAEGVVDEWCRGFGDEDGHPRYRGVPGMTAMAKWLTAPLHVRTSTRVTSVSPGENLWRIMMEDGDTLAAKRIVITPPIEQSLTLLDDDAEAALADVIPPLRQVEYDPCFALLLRLSGPSGLDTPGVLRPDHPDIDWMADNFVKGTSPVQGTVTVHASATFTRAYFDDTREDVAKRLIDTVHPWLASEASIWQLHRWRYSKPVDTLATRCIAAASPAPIVFAGDAFAGPRVEGAALSGMAAAEALL